MKCSGNNHAGVPSVSSPGWWIDLRVFVRGQKLSKISKLWAMAEQLRCPYRITTQTSKCCEYTSTDMERLLMHERAVHRGPRRWWAPSRRSPRSPRPKMRWTPRSPGGLGASQEVNVPLPWVSTIKYLSPLTPRGPAYRHAPMTWEAREAREGQIGPPPGPGRVKYVTHYMY